VLQGGFKERNVEQLNGRELGLLSGSMDDAVGLARLRALTMIMSVIVAGVIRRLDLRGARGRLFKQVMDAVGRGRGDENHKERRRRQGMQGS
jgi:hypothetical protein